MTVDFADYFWGEKNEGFNSLQQSLKSGPISAKELGEYLRDCAKIQEDHSKAQLKILKTLNGSNTSSLSSLGPLMALFKPFTERVAGMHHEHMSKLGELAKKTFKYAEELSKRQKSLKEETSSTSEVVKSFQDITLQLNKSKELYKQKCIELNKLTRSGEKEKADKAELKFRKAQEDYKNLVTQYCTLRETFEDKLTAYARHCQEMERAHLTQMRDIVTVYFSEVLLHNQQLSQTNEDFTLQLDKLSVNHLLEQFTIHHHTGLEKPGPIEFEEEKVSVASIPGEPVSDLSDRSANSDKLSLNSFNKKEPAASCTNPAASAAQVVISSTSGSGGNLSSSPIPSVSSADNDHLSALAVDGSSNYENEDASKTGAHTGGGWTVPGFLKRRKDKKRKSKDEKESNNDSAPETSSNKMGSDGEDQNKSDTPTPEVDSSERLSKTAAVHSAVDKANLDPWAEFNESKNNFYSSSDESDDETKHKIKVEIKPVCNSNPPISASVDELRSAIGTLDIAPPPPRDIFENGTNEKLDIRRSQSQSHLVHKPSEDLLGLSLHPMGEIDISSNGKDNSSKGGGDGSSNKQLMDVSHNSNNMPATSKEVRDIFKEVDDSPPPSKEAPRDRVSNSLIALPRPPSRHGPQYPLPSSAQSRGKNSPSSAAATSSLGGNKDSTRESPHPFSSSSNSKFPHFGSSRGPSPLTLGMSDNIPLAVAFQEVIHACFHGSDESQCQVRLIGDMMISFPAGIIQMITHNPLTSPLLFRIKNAGVLESIVPNKQLINTATALSSDGETAFEFNMKNLKDLLKSQSMQNPNASYFNIDILKYQIRAQSGAKSCPLQLVAYWKNDSGQTDLRLNYKYNASAMATPAPLLNLSIAVPIDGGVSNMISKPSGTWIAENNRALWTFKELRPPEESASAGGLQAIRGRFELTSGPGSQNTIAAQFNCEGSTLSGIDIELLGSGYRLSLIKKRFVSGKYICDAEGKEESRFRYAAFTPSSALGSDC